MRVFASLLAASLALASPAAASPRRVASLNLCTDELVLAIATPDQIVSVTHLSQDEAETPLWRRGRQYARNDGSLLSVADLRPDLVVTMGGGIRDRSAIAARLGIPTLDLPFAASLDDVEANIRRVATALGQPARGAALIRRIESLRAASATTGIFVIASEPKPDLILGSMRAGANEFFTFPPPDEMWHEAIRRTATRRVAAGHGQAGTMFVFFGAKGGAGTTTLAVNSAVEIARVQRISLPVIRRWSEREGAREGFETFRRALTAARKAVSALTATPARPRTGRRKRSPSGAAPSRSRAAAAKRSRSAGP